MVDIYTSYMEIVQALFSNTKIITDRFHVLQALNNLCVNIMNLFRDTDHKIYNKFKNYDDYFLTPGEKLDTCHY